MRTLLLLLAPMLGYSQLDTTLVYRQKEVHSIIIKADSSGLSWAIDTIPYLVPFEIKFNKVKKTIAIDGYGTYKVAEYSLHQSGYHAYKLSNGGEVGYIAGSVIWTWPISRRKTKTIIFKIE
jgi:hypothetical protein